MYTNVRRLALLAMLDLAQRSTPREKPMSDLSKLPLYQCHKRVRAVQIASIYPPDIPVDQEWEGSMVIAPVDERYGPFRVDRKYIAKHQPKVGGYFVLYEDGYQSYSPAEAFESGYTLVDDSPKGAFEDAMVELVNAKDGRGRPVHLYRGNWTADDMRDATKAFVRPVIAADEVTFLNGLNEPTADEQRASETAFWENLAKLAKATAAAIRAGL